ncbi:MAG: DNA repair protein RecO [Patescibacteria group bacterium]
MTSHLNGIILESQNFRENDRVLIFYSQELGKIEILVRGARKIKSKLNPFISPFALLELVVAPGKSFYHLIGGEVKRYFKGVSGDYKKIIHATNLFRRISVLINLHRPDSKISVLLVRFLEKIDQINPSKIQIIYYACLIKLLSLLGYRPEIKQCFDCRKDAKLLGENIYFDFEKGGICCVKCRENRISAVKINSKILEILHNLLYKNFDYLENWHFDEKSFLAAQNIIKKFYRWHLK